MKDRKAMKTRRILAIICYTIGFCAYGAAGYVCWLSWNGTISNKQGFLTFLPIWIVSRQWAIKKRARHVLSDISTVLSVVLLCFWIYVYVSQYTELLNFK